MRIRLGSGSGGGKGLLASWLQPAAITVRIDLREYSALDLSYAVTTMKGQGVTTGRAFVLAGGPMTHREMIYVQMSRAYDETRLYCDEAAAGEGLTRLVRAMETSRPKIWASEIAQAAANPERPELYKPQTAQKPSRFPQEEAKREGASPVEIPRRQKHTLRP